MVRLKKEQTPIKTMRVLYFRLGDQDNISFVMLVRLLKNIKQLLQDFDAALSRNPYGEVRWEVSVLEKKSPILLGLTGEIVRRRGMSHAEVDPMFPDKVGNAVLSSTVGLAEKGERSSLISDSAIEHYRKLADSTKKVGPISVYDDNTGAQITEDTLTNIARLTGKKSQNVGSILGKLDSISVHRGNEIRVWDENTGRPITCRYPIALEETVKAALRDRVLVSGIVNYNVSGRPFSLEMREIIRYPNVNELPSIEEMAGSVSDVTGGQTLEDFMRRLRDE